MSFLGSFFGTDQRRDINRAKTKADAALAEGTAAARTGFANATERLDPYAETGARGNAMYSDAIGLNGRDAQQGVVTNFMADPFRAQNEQQSNEQLARQFGARGMGGSGAFALAGSRANIERGSADWNHMLDRWNGVGTMGAQVSGQQAGIDAAGAQMEADAGTTRAGNEINYGNATAAARGIGINNLLGVAGTAVRAFTPGWGGTSAAGSIWNAMTGGSRAGAGTSTAVGKMGAPNAMARQPWEMATYPDGWH